MMNHMKEKLDRGEPVIGTFFQMCYPGAVEALGQTGLDFVVIDTEHGPFDTETMAHMILAAEHTGLTPVVRIGDVTHKEIQRAADLGAGGIIAPCLRQISDFHKLVSLAKFPPLGQRGYALGRGSGYGYQSWADTPENYMHTSNERLMVIPQCETIECLESIEEVAAIDGIDAVFIGPYDLSVCLGIPTRFEDPVFKAALKRIKNACDNAGKPVLIYTASIEKARQYLKEGYQGIAHNTDTNTLIQGYRQQLEEILR